MANDWRCSQLIDVIDFVADNRGRNPESYSDKGIPVIDNYLIVSEGYVNLDEVKRYINERTYESFIRKSIKKNDVLITLVGNGYGQVALTPSKKCVIIQNTIGLRCNSNNDNIFLYYLLKNNRKALMNLNIGAAQPSIKVGYLTNLEFRFPPLAEQKAIAHILGSLDDKIELNRQMNETLEAMAQALFKSWFVDFDPVIDNALAAGKPIPDELSERAEQRKAMQYGDNQAVRALFPDEFELTEQMGWIPKGWEIKNSGDLFDVRDGTHDSPKKADKGKYLITSRHITSGIIDYPNAYLISQNDFEEVNKRSKVESYDILITMIGTVGISMIVLQDQIDFAIKNVGLFKTSNNRNYAIFFYLYLNQNYMKQFLESRLAGTTQKYLTLKILRALPIVKPNSEVLHNFVKNISPIFEKIHFNNEQIETLANIRDTLLPKLLSGELRIPDAAALVEDI